MTNYPHVLRALDLSGSLLLLAEEGEGQSSRDDCLVFFGVIRDCAYKIQAAAAQCHNDEDEAGSGSAACAPAPLIQEAEATDPDTVQQGRDGHGEN